MMMYGIDESLHSIPETNTTAYVNSTGIEIQKIKKQSSRMLTLRVPARVL